ncbi:hypothetical protein PoB_001715400 [Plakobranchus ocellatus]|uniref:Uncharacterized protein n=1 Tax=Plakobranchus ocellatus TaxID=259542 RepID=A0AAV3Z8A9_9GAST|nr:hypothetical protein PoB_001715400 [Plakobranchus ocellatus]
MKTRSRLVVWFFGFLCIASPQQGDLRPSGPPLGHRVGGGTRTRDRGVPADLRADTLAFVPSTPLDIGERDKFSGTNFSKYLNSNS